MTLVQCNYSGNTCINTIGNNLCKYGDCCGQAEVCTNVLGGYTCTHCPEGTTKVGNRCAYHTSLDITTTYSNYTTSFKTINTTTITPTITTTTTPIITPTITTLLAVVAGQEIHCPYQQFATFLCTEWCRNQEQLFGLQCAE